MKNIMWKYFTANNTQKYIDVLPNMVEKYNNTYGENICVVKYHASEVRSTNPRGILMQNLSMVKDMKWQTYRKRLVMVIF